METGPLIALRSFVERAHRSPWSPHSVSAAHEVSLWGKIRLGGFLWLRRCSLSLLPGWVSIGLQVHTLARRPPVAPTNCSIHSSAGDGRRPLIGYQRRLGNFPTASACWQPASHSSSPPGHTRGRRGEGSHGPKVHWAAVKVSPKILYLSEDGSLRGLCDTEWQRLNHLSAESKAKVMERVEGGSYIEI